MKTRSIKNLPVFYENSAEVIGRVEKTVIGDDHKIAYLVICSDDGAQKLILRDDFVLTPASVIVNNLDSIKSYAHGEELSIYEQKLGDKIFDSAGQELGILSDFIISNENKTVSGVEVSSGAIKDFLEGRIDIELDKVHWASMKSAVVDEGSDMG
jgi:sporulation protein YlmC with PRC-barrel domain